VTRQGFAVTPTFSESLTTLTLVAFIFAFLFLLLFFDFFLLIAFFL
jgi:hypothetical protein